MLELRPNCDKDLPPDAVDARICSEMWEVAETVLVRPDPEPISA
jgi:hypothetical protein